MIILGLHFGHDASVSVVEDGRVLACLEIERLTRVKHAMGIRAEHVLTALSDVGLGLNDVDYCAITSTQLVEWVNLTPSDWSFSLERSAKHNFPCTMTDQLVMDEHRMQSMSSGWLEHVFANMPDHPYTKYFSYLKPHLSDKNNIFGSFEHFVWLAVWGKVLTFSDMEKTNYAPLFNSQEVSQGFHFPATVNFKDHKIPAYFFSHHFAHAAYAFYSSDFSEAAILSHDGGGGGVGYGSGMFYHGSQNRLYPITPHNLFIGEVYDTTGVVLGFDAAGAAGKLMGLSAYGKPRLFSRAAVGNWFDLGCPSPDYWTKHCLDLAKISGYDLNALGLKEKILDSVNVDIAASTQKLTEEVMLRAVEVFHRIYFNSNQTAPKGICLTGGVALNCPTNTRIVNEGPFEKIHVPPAVSDMGLSIGASLALYHNVMNHPRKIAKVDSQLAYLGLNGHCSSTAITDALDHYRARINSEKQDDYVLQAAKDLADNKIVGWFHGRSEIGPRALGHRSILSHPQHKENWRRVNQVKSREWWRPFAPIVLQEKIHEYFSGTQTPSWFMLLNAQVIVNDLPAITHADRSARIQSVSETNGAIFNLLKEFDRLTGVPVLMNTSFNGPKEPIVETPHHAIEFLLNSELDVLYFEGHRVWRRT